ncbi:MAG TPA: quercetin 2,3-dioxygenase [Pseudonocardiaceae bacterium]|nr:quercetin 2,3-dioxygenase [Pseudonocardiaceae bacterium]
MSFEYLADPAAGPRWRHVLPGAPEPFFLSSGEGEHAMLFTDLFTVLLSGDETEGQFGVFTSAAPRGQLIPAHNHADTHETFYVIEGAVRVYVEGRDGRRTSRLLNPGDFGFVPAGLSHAYQVEQSARLLGVATAGFERFFQHMGTPTEHATAEQPPFIPSLDRMRAAGEAHHTRFQPELDWSDAT